MSVTAPVALIPPVNVCGEIVKLLSHGKFTRMVACGDTEPCVAVIVTVVGEIVWRLPVIANVTLIEPAGIVTEVDGRETSDDDFVSVMTTGVAARAVSVIVPVAVAPFRIDVGEIVSELSSGSANVSVA